MVSLASVLLLVTMVSSQGRTPGAPQGPAINATTDPLLQSFRFRSIGPASMGGRIDDIVVSESDPNIVYIGYVRGVSDGSGSLTLQTTATIDSLTTYAGIAKWYVFSLTATPFV